MKKIIFFKSGVFPEVSESFLVNKIIFLKKYTKSFEPIIICKNIKKIEETQPYISRLKSENIKIYEYKKEFNTNSENKLYQKTKFKIWNMKNFQYNINTFFIKCLKFIYFRTKKINKLISKKTKNNKLENITKILKYENSNIINCIYGNYISDIYELKKKLNLKIILSFHGKDATLLKKNKKLTCLCKKYGDLYLVRSNNMKEKLLKVKLNSEKIKIQKSGFYLEKNLNYKKKINKIFQITSVGRLVEKKGFDTLIKAAKILKKKNVTFKINIYGAGPDYQKIKNLINKHELNKIVNLNKQQENKKIKKIIAKSDLFILASKTASTGDEEGIPIVLMEAMALKTLCLSTKTSGIPEIISHKKTGYLVEPNNSKQLANNILKIMDEKKEKKLEITNNAFNKITKEYNYKTIINQYINNIQKIIK